MVPYLFLKGEISEDSRDSCLRDVLVTDTENVADSSTPWCNNLTRLNIKYSSTEDTACTQGLPQGKK